MVYIIKLIILYIYPFDLLLNLILFYQFIYLIIISFNLIILIILIIILLYTKGFIIIIHQLNYQVNLINYKFLFFI